MNDCRSWPGLKIPLSIKEPNGILGKLLLLLVTSSDELSCSIVLVILLLATSIYDLSFSIPINFLPNFFATAPVVPVPKKGSRTISPLLEEPIKILCNKASGF